MHHIPRPCFLHNSQKAPKNSQAAGCRYSSFSHIHPGSLLLAKSFYRRRSVPPSTHKSCAPSTAAPMLFFCSAVGASSPFTRILPEPAFCTQLHGNTLSLQVPFPTHKGKSHHCRKPFPPGFLLVWLQQVPEGALSEGGFPFRSLPACWQSAGAYIRSNTVRAFRHLAGYFSWM